MSFADRVQTIVSDARHWQISALTALLLYSFAFLDFGATLAQTLAALLSVMVVQAAFSRLRHERFEWRSSLITGLSLSLLLRTGDLAVMAFAAFFAIASKFTLRVQGKHIFNPAAVGIAVALLVTHRAWVSPGQWGASVWIVALILLLGGAVLTRAPRLDMALAYLGAHFGLLLARAAWLGDPLTIPLHQMMTGSLLVFAFFMITDPRSTPDSRSGRILFALAVAGLAHWLAFFEQIRPSLYFALLMVSPLVPAIDRTLPSARFQWSAKAAA